MLFSSAFTTGQQEVSKCCKVIYLIATLRQPQLVPQSSHGLCMQTGGQAIAEQKNSSTLNGEHTASVKVDLRTLGAEDNVESGTGRGGPGMSSRSLGGGSAGGSRRSMEVGDPAGGPTTSTRSLGAVSAGASSAGGSRRSLEAGRRAAGPTLRAPKFIVPPGQLVGICGEVVIFASSSWILPSFCPSMVLWTLSTNFFFSTAVEL